jgi:hypothetical protein
LPGDWTLLFGKPFARQLGFPVRGSTTMPVQSSRFGDLVVLEEDLTIPDENARHFHSSIVIRSFIEGRDRLFWTRIRADRKDPGRSRVQTVDADSRRT